MGDEVRACVLRCSVCLCARMRAYVRRVLVYMHGRLSLAHRGSGFLAGRTEWSMVFAVELVGVGDTEVRQRCVRVVLSGMLVYTHACICTDSVRHVLVYICMVAGRLPIADQDS